MILVQCDEDAMNVCCNVRTDIDGHTLSVDGGKPMNLTGPIVLCGRSDNDTARGYEGRISQLAVFDNALTPLQVYTLYRQVRHYC